MNDVYSIALEVNDNGSIVIKNFKKNVEDAGGAAEGAGKKAGEDGAEGFHLFGIAAAKAGDQLGIPYKASNMLGTQVEKLARSAFPAWGAALGIAGGAAMVAAGAIMYFIKQKEEETKAREENIARIRSELSEMDQLRLKTVEMIAAQRQESESKKAELLREVPKQITSHREALSKLVEKYNDLYAVANNYQKAAANRFSLNEGEVALIQKATEARDKAADAIEKEYAQIVKLETLKQAVAGKGKATVIEESNPFWKQDMQFQAAGIKEMQDAYLRARDARIGYDQARLDSARATGASMNQLQDMELQVFDDTTSKIILSAKTRDEAEAQYDARKIQRGTLTIAYQKQMNAALKNLDLMYHQTHLNIASQALDAYVAVTGKRNAAIFLMQKALAIGQIWLDTERAAMAAAAFGAMTGGVTGGHVAYAQMKALGTISMAMAAATALGQVAMGTWSGGGGGNGAGGVYAASPGTGQPAAYQIYYEQNPNNPRSGGTGWRPGEGQNNGPIYVYAIRGDVYAQDSDSFKQKMVSAASENIKDKGVLYDAIHG